MEPSLLHYNILASLLFTIGTFGILFNRKSIIGILIAIEVILLAANINFVAASALLANIEGQIFSIFILGVAAAEIAVGLAIIVMYFKKKGNIRIEELETIKD